MGNLHHKLDMQGMNHYRQAMASLGGGSSPSHNDAENSGGGYLSMVRRSSVIAPANAANSGGGQATGRQNPHDMGLADPSLVTPYLLLGGSMVNKNPELVNYLGITHVVNMAIEIQPNYDLVNKRAVIYKHIRSDDSLQYNIRVHFEEAFSVIDEARATNGRVLVHCMMGISRSGLCVFLFTIKTMKRLGLAFFGSCYV